VVKGLKVNREKMMSNLMMSGGAVLAEPAYILLAEAGEGDAHEIIRKITLTAEKEHVNFETALKRYPEAFDQLKAQLSKLGHTDPDAFFSHPAAYNGQAEFKAKTLSAKYEKAMTELLAGLERN
jgi:adenylosuccinate lyase